MRTERRHELQTNVLADWLNVQIERILPYSRIVVAVVLGLIVLGGVGMYWRGQTAAREDQQWSEYFQAMDAIRYLNKPEAMIALTASPDFQNTPAGYWAALGMGDYYLREGTNQLFSDRAASANAMRSALRSYAQVTQQTKYPMLAQRALLEMGAAHEGLNELEDARKQYDKIVSGWPGGSFEAVAKQRIAELDRRSTPEFYDWFFAMSPPRGGVLGPGVPGMRPNFNETPSEGSFLPPKGDDPPADATPVAPEGTTPEAGTPATPATPDAETPATEKPATDAPAETPAATEPPATDPPAATPPEGESPKS